LFYATFTYNDEGLRLSTTINGETTTYLYDGSVLIAEYAPNYTCVYIYDESGAIIGVKYISTAENSAWQTYFFEKNLQGDVIAVYSDTGTKLISYHYDAWGNATTTYHNGGASTLAANNPIRYRSYYYDTTLQMYYLQSRYYDAKICRFISPDDVSYLGANGDLISYNMYAYCSNNPVNYVDPSGHSFIVAALILVATTVIGAIVGGTISYEQQTERIKNNSTTDDETKQNDDVSIPEIALYAATGAGIGLATGGIILMGAGVGYGLFKVATAGKSIAKVAILGIEAGRWAALGFLSFDIGTFIASTISGISFEMIEWISPYNTEQPIIPPIRNN